MKAQDAQLLAMSSDEFKKRNPAASKILQDIIIEAQKGRFALILRQDEFNYLFQEIKSKFQPKYDPAIHADEFLAHVFQMVKLFEGLGYECEFYNDRFEISWLNL
jgi:hypothetical protein